MAGMNQTYLRATRKRKPDLDLIAGD